MKKVPGSVHLGRRVDYLFTLLRDEESDSSVGGSTPVGSVRKRIRKSTPVPHNSGSSNGSHNTLSGNSNGGTANNTGKHRKPVKLESSEKLAKQKG